MKKLTFFYLVVVILTWTRFSSSPENRFLVVSYDLYSETGVV